jgi:hypothetical protein
MQGNIRTLHSRGQKVILSVGGLPASPSAAGSGYVSPSVVNDLADARSLTLQVAGEGDRFRGDERRAGL